MLEICYCGRKGRIEDREPVSTGDGDRTLSCPSCGHKDGLEWLPDETRTLLFAEAEGEPPPAAGLTVDAGNEPGQRPEGGDAGDDLGAPRVAQEDDASARSIQTPRRRDERIAQGAYT